MTSQIQEQGEAKKAIPIRNVWYLLIYAWDLANWRDTARFDSEQSPNLLGLLARVLVDSTRLLLRHQLRRDYVKRVASIEGVRGRILFTPSLRHIGLKENKLVCSFEELDVNTRKNQIIKTTLYNLSRDARVSGATSETSAALNRDIHTLLDQMAGVQSIRLSHSDFTSIRTGRNDRDYALPINICFLVHMLKMPSTESGDETLALLSEDLNGSFNLFERFVRNFYRHHIGDRYHISARNLDWPGVSNAHMPIMKTDISIESRKEPFNKLIIDTKFYEETLTRGFGDLKFRSDHLYQIYAYLRTQEDLGPSFRNAKGMLLYPNVGLEISEIIELQGHEIRIETIDLANDWEQIESNLLALVEI